MVYLSDSKVAFNCDKRNGRGGIFRGRNSLTLLDLSLGRPLHWGSYFSGYRLPGTEFINHDGSS